MRNVKLLIIGAGPCGLGAAREMVEEGRSGENDFLLVDPQAQPGGWARSVHTPEGFTFDFGGHVLFPHKHYTKFGDVLEEANLQWSSTVPQRGLETQGVFLPYPAQRNIHRLPKLSLFRALCSVLVNRFRTHAPETDMPVPGGDLRNYLRRHFGRYLTTHLLGPLNRKQWAHVPQVLTDVWTQHKSGSATRNVPTIRLRSILRNLLTRTDDVGWTPETRVSYPATGGTGAIWNTVARAIPAERMMLGVSVVEISLKGKTAKLSNGETVAWEQMLSSMPLDRLLSSIPENPDLAAKAKRFVRARSRLFGFGVEGRLPERYTGLHSCQMPDASVPFWRLNFPMTVSEGNGPAGCYSMLCEASEPAATPGQSDEVLAAKVEKALRDRGLLDGPGQKVVSRWSISIDHGYPVPFLGRDELLAEVQPILDAAGVYSRGRFGSWRYEISNQDHAYMQGVEAVHRVLYGTREETFGHAEVVNEIAPIVEPAATMTPQPVTFATHQPI